MPLKEAGMSRARGNCRAANRARAGRAACPPGWQSSAFLDVHFQRIAVQVFRIISV